MANHIPDLPFWEGFSVTSLDVVDARLHVRLETDPERPLLCSHCGASAPTIHETVWRTVRDLPMAGLPVYLNVAVNRLRCATCGRCCMQRVDWLDRHARVSRRLAEFVAHWSEKLPIAHVCELAGLHWGTVHQIHRQDLEHKVAALPPPQPTRLVMDEFALFKGHRYATVVLDADTRRVIWVCEGRDCAPGRGV